MKRFQTIAIVLSILVLCFSCEDKSGLDDVEKSICETGDVSDITNNTAVVSGTAYYGKLKEIKEKGFLFSTKENFLSSYSTLDRNIVQLKNYDVFKAKLLYLVPETKYYYCSYVIDEQDNKHYGIIKSFTTRKTINCIEYVDLGLSVKWATCNVGAENLELSNLIL